MLSVLEKNHLLPLCHMANRFISLEETKQRINEFSIGYMINPKMNINKAFREQVHTCINNTFGPIPQPYIRSTIEKRIQEQ